MSEDVEATARSMGWAPKEQFKGDPEKWVDAAEYVSRGETVMPLLKANNRRLQQELEGERRQRQGLETSLNELRESVETLKSSSIEETKRQVKAERVRVLEQLKKARKDGDHDAAVDLEDDLRQIDKTLDAAEAPAPAKKDGPTKKAADPVQDPTYQAWIVDNPWLQDPVKAAAAVAIAEKLRKDGDTSTGRAFFDKITEAAEETFNMKARPRGPGKVEPSRGGAGDGHRDGKRGVADLPAEARAQIDKEAKQMVGPNRAFKTKAEWEAHFVEQYFAGEAA
jgi:hypothetical protein